MNETGPINHDPDLDPIPPEFYSFETEKPFTECLVCKGDLLAREKEYGILKHYVSNEVVVEIAVCDECDKEAYVSEESAKKLIEFMPDSGAMSDRKWGLRETSPHQVGPWISHCLICKKAREESKEYTIVADCSGPDIIFWETPYMVCGDCSEVMNDCLSDATRDWWNGWVENNLDCPPEMKERIEQYGLVFF